MKKSEPPPYRALLGEYIGTFLLILFGLSAVASTVTMDAHQGLLQISLIWGLGLTTAILATQNLSGAHLNPAISLALVLFRNFPKQRFLPYVGAQFVGAMTAAMAVYLLFGQAISSFETTNNLPRGESGSEASAMIFGEFYPSPGGKPLSVHPMGKLSSGKAFLAETLGTAILAFAVFSFTHPKNRESMGKLTPYAIGIALTALITVFGPLTMACFNPARDLGPRLLSSLVGWGSYPFTVNGLGCTVYIIARV